MKNNEPSASWTWILLALLTLYIVWGSTYLAIRVGVETFPPFLMGSTRFVVAGTLLFAAVYWWRGVSMTGRQVFDSAVGAFFMLLGGNGLVGWAEQAIPSGVTTLVISLNPVFFVVAEWLVSRRGGTSGGPNRWTWAGLIVGFLGLLILVAPSLGEGSGEVFDLWRLGGLIFACLNWTIGSMYIRHVPKPAEPMAGAAVQMLWGGPLMLAASYLAGELNGFRWSDVAPEAWWAWWYLIVAGSLLGYTSFIWLMKHSSPTLVSTYGYVNPIVAVFLGWWFLGEPVGPRIALASCTIIAGVAMVSWSKRSLPPVGDGAAENAPEVAPEIAAENASEKA
jgi:drug/metabolite transporter (DMT)-like permease